MKNQTTTVDNAELGVEDLVTGDGNTENPGLKFESVFTQEDAVSFKWDTFATANADKAFFITLAMPEFEEIMTADGSYDVDGVAGNDT